MGRSNSKSSGGARPSPNKSENDILSIEALLDDIESEESQLADAFPNSFDSFDDTIADDPENGKFDDFEELDDFDDLDDFDKDLVTEDDSRSGTEAETQPTAAEPVSPQAAEPEDSPAEKTDSTDIPEPTVQFDAGFWDDLEGDRQAGGQGFAGSLRKVMGGKDGKSNYTPLIIIGLLVVIIVILLMQNCGGTAQRQEDWFDTSAIEGTLPGKTPEEIQAMLNQIVEEGMFNISIAPVIVFENPQAQGQARIENVPANHYHMSVKITLDDTQDTIYESKGIRPGQYIEYITLQKELQPGEYAATALFSAYDADTLGEQGRVAVKIKIIVE